MSNPASETYKALFGDPAALTPEQQKILDAIPEAGTAGASDFTPYDISCMLAEAKNCILDRMEHDAIGHIESAMAALASATTITQDWRAIEKFTDEFIDDYEMRGESEDGRDACYQPNDGDKALMRDMLAGLFAEPEFIRLLAAAPASGDGK